MCQPRIAIAPTAETPSAAAIPHNAPDRVASAATAVGAASPRSKIAFTMRQSSQFQRSASSWYGETITAAAHGLDHLMNGVRLERETEPTDMNVDRSLLDIDMIAPNLVEQLRAAVDALRSRHE